MSQDMPIAHPKIERKFPHKLGPENRPGYASPEKRPKISGGFPKELRSIREICWATRGRQGRRGFSPHPPAARAVSKLSCWVSSRLKTAWTSHNDHGGPRSLFHNAPPAPARVRRRCWLFDERLPRVPRSVGQDRVVGASLELRGELLRVDGGRLRDPVLRDLRVVP
jgi:hypothetical protein